MQQFACTQATIALGDSYQQRMGVQQMNIKARKTDNALRQLRAEEWEKGDGKVIIAIDDFLATASDATKAKLYDIVTGS